MKSHYAPFVLPMSLVIVVAFSTLLSRIPNNTVQVTATVGEQINIPYTVPSHLQPAYLVELKDYDRVLTSQHLTPPNRQSMCCDYGELAQRLDPQLLRSNNLPLAIH